MKIELEINADKLPKQHSRDYNNENRFGYQHRCTLKKFSREYNNENRLIN